jgi:hypothetical protein
MNFKPQLSLQNIKTSEEYQQLFAYIELNALKQILDTYGRFELQIVLDEFADYKVEQGKADVIQGALGAVSMLNDFIGTFVPQ